MLGRLGRRSDGLSESKKTIQSEKGKLSVTEGKAFYPHPLYYPVLVAVLLITSGLCALYASAPVAAEPEVLGSISGMVRDHSGVPVGDIELTLSSASRPTARGTIALACCQRGSIASPSTTRPNAIPLPNITKMQLACKMQQQLP